MQKLNIFLAITCALILQQANAGYKRRHPSYYNQFKMNYTETLNYTQEIDVTIHSEAQTFTLSNNESRMFIQPSNPDMKLCQLNLTTTLGYAYQVAAFNDKIVLWDQQTYADNVIGTTLLLIDPISCNYTNIEVPKDIILENQPPYKAQVVTYKNIDYFDIFYGGRNACMPCRFNSLGEEKVVKFQLGNETIQDASPYLIRPLKESHPNHGYFYARSFYNGSLWTEINLLKHNFSVFRQIYVNHAVDEVAINDNNYSDIVVCYKEEEQKYTQVIQNDGQKVWRMIVETNVYCDVYDKYFYLESHIKLAVPKDHYVNGISVNIGMNELSLCVAVPHISYDGKDNKYAMSFFRFNGLNRQSTELYGSLGSLKRNIDEREGYNLKVRAARLLHYHCP